MKRNKVAINPKLGPPNTKGESSEILILNVSSARCAELYHSRAPKHLGIGIVLTYAEDAEDLDQMVEEMQARIAKAVLITHLVYDTFRSEFLPVGIDKVTVVARTGDMPDWVRSATGKSKQSLSIVLFDGDSAFSEDRLIDAMAAMVLVATAAVATGSYELPPLKTIEGPTEFAQAHEQAVGNLFASGQTVWCEELVALRYILWSGVRAALADKSMVDAMRVAKTVIPTPLDYTA